MIWGQLQKHSLEMGCLFEKGYYITSILTAFLLLSSSQQTTLPHTAQDIVAYNAAAFAVVVAAAVFAVAVAVFLT